MLIGRSLRAHAAIQPTQVTQMTQTALEVQGWGKPSPYHTRIGWPFAALEAASIRADSVYVHCRVRYIMPGCWPAVRSASACTRRNLS